MMVKVNATITITLNAILVIRVWVRAMKWAISGDVVTIIMVSRVT